MATLTETAYYTRRSVNWSILALVSYIILKIFWSLLVTSFVYLFPPKEPPPTHGYGVLPAPVFPARPDIPDELTLKLETITGTVPDVTAKTNVYYMPKKAANLLALSETQNFAKQFQLNPTPIRETKNLYRFQDDDFTLRKMQYDIVSHNFILKYDYSRDTGLFRDKNLKTPEAYTSEARALLQNRGLYEPDLSNGSAVTTYLRLSGDTLYPTASLSQTDAVKVDFFRGPVDDIPVFTPYPDDGQVSMIFSGSRESKKRLLELSYTFWPIDYEARETYSLKTGQQAWQELKDGQGYIARYPSEGNEAIIRNAYLGYYDTFEPQTYLQPIIVFEGDFGFLGYVHAVNPLYVEQKE